MFLASFRVGTVLENLAMLTTQRKHGNEFLSLYRTSWKMNFSKKKGHEKVKNIAVPKYNDAYQFAIAV